MQSLRRKPLLLGALILGTAIIGIRWLHSPTVLTEPVPAKLPATAKVAPPDTLLPVAPPAERKVSPPAAPAAIRAILPSVTSAVLNWREYRPDRYIVRGDADRPEITFQVEAIKEEPAFTTWIGRSALPGESFIAVATRDGLDAVLTTYDGPPVEIHIRGSKVSVLQADAFADEEICATVPPPGRLTSAALSLAPQEIQLEGAAAASGMDDGAGNRLSRVACFYDASTLAHASLCAPDGNGASLINSTLRARLEAGNVALANSQINVRWVYLGCALAPAPSGTIVQDIYNELLRTGPLGDFARQTAAEWGATQIFLVCQSITGTYAGMANLPGHYAVGFWNRNYFLMVHELAHNFGLRHDRYTDNAVSTPNDGVYSYAIDLISTTPGNRQIVGTIMSYAHYFVPYYSNANLTLNSAITTHFYTADFSGTYQVVPPVYTNGTAGNFYYGAPNGTINSTLITATGVGADVQPLGIPAGQPYAADASRTFRETAASVITGGWYVEPAISSQPQGATVQPGQNFSLSITTRGTGAFAYQWYKGAGALTGATGTSYAVASATAGDAAVYSVIVTVSDVTGTTTILTSNNATITVSAPTPPPTPTPPSNSGGGGAMSLDFAAALFVFATIRFLRPLGRPIST